MSMIGVDYGVLNQKGSPSWFSDIYANIPTAGYKGRMFISIDTYAFYRDTGTGWDLIGGPGTGTLTGSGTTGQVSFFNGTQTITGNNNLFWDNTNSRLGINTTTPGAPLDIHATGTNAQFNGTGTSNAYLTFQNAGTSKWRIGNTYNAGANSFDIYNVGLTTTILSISSTTNTMTLSTNLTTTGSQSVQNGLYLSNANAGAQAFYTNIWGRDDGINFALRNLTGGAGFIFQSAASYNYTFPATTGTLALTSDLSSYLPLAGGTLTGLLNSSAFGNNSFSSGGTGYNKITIRNTTAGVANGAQLSIGTNADADQFYVQSFATTFTTSGMNVAGGAVVNGEGPGGLNLAATQSSIGFYTGGSGSGNLRMQIGSAGEVTIGNAVAATNVYLYMNGVTNKATRIVFQESGSSKWLVGNGAASENGRFEVFDNTNGTGVQLLRNSTAWVPLTSDIRLKKNFETCQGLNEVLQIEPVKYHLLFEDNNSNKKLGFKAQNIQSLIPEMVVTNGRKADDGSDYLTIIPDYLLPVLVKAIQELNEKLVRNNIN